VAIVGGGIGGLGAALALRRFGHHPVVVEQARELRPVGAGISLWPNGVKVLNLLGLGEAIASIGGRMERMAYAGRDGRMLLDFPLSLLYDRVGERARPVERSALQELMLGEVGGDTVSLGVRAVAVEEAGAGVVLRTEGAGRIEADLVVAADGTHSALREHVVGHRVERGYVGYVNWNGLVEESEDLAPIGTWLTFVGEAKRVSLMPVGRGRLYWFFDVPMPLAAASSTPGEAGDDGGGTAGGSGGVAGVLGAAFEGWAAPVRSLIERIDPTGVARIPIHATPPLETWRRGKVVLLGDAAHTMPPDLGQGGCQALEDAWVLSHYLTSTSRGVEDALERYQAERLPHTTAMQQRAERRAALIHGSAPEATAGWYRSLASGSHEDIVDGLAQSVESGPCR